MSKVGRDGQLVSNRQGGTARRHADGIIIGLGSGLASALLFYSAARGSPVFGTILLFLTRSLVGRWSGLGVAALRSQAAMAGAVAVGATSAELRCRLFPGARLSGRRWSAYLAYLSRPNPPTRRRANGIRRVGWWRPCRYMAGALPMMRAAADRRQLRVAASAMGEFLQQFAKRRAPA